MVFTQYSSLITTKSNNYFLNILTIMDFSSILILMDGSRLKELREAFNMTQVELAKRLHVTPSLIVKWETENVTPRRATIVQLAKIFGCSIDYLFGVETKELTGPEQKLLNELKHLNESQIKALVKLVQALQQKED